VTLKLTALNTAGLPCTPTVRRALADVQARLGRCPRCCTTIPAREAGPRCPRCGLREGS
jgi:hypothetical protein